MSKYFKLSLELISDNRYVIFFSLLYIFQNKKTTIWKVPCSSKVKRNYHKICSNSCLSVLNHHLSCLDNKYLVPLEMLYIFQNNKTTPRKSRRTFLRPSLVWHNTTSDQHYLPPDRHLQGCLRIFGPGLRGEGGGTFLFINVVACL